MSLVSVIVVTYNQMHFIKDAVVSILNQNVSFAVEILIGDDCSSDDTESVVRGLIESNRNPNFYIKYYRHKRNIGISKNAFFLLKKARGKFIAFCDGDDFWINKNKLSLQLNILINNDNINVVASHHLRCVNDNMNLFPDLTLYKEYSSGADFFYERSCLLLSILIRNNVEWPLWLSQVYPFDKFVVLVGSNFKPIFTLDDKLVCYRLNSESITKKKFGISFTIEQSIDHYYGLKKAADYFAFSPHEVTYQVSLRFYETMISLIGKNYLNKFFVVAEASPFLFKNYKIVNIRKLLYLFLHS